jgi:tetratricopeptide (TPR) repeat protein
LNSLAALHSRLGDSSTAEALLRQALDLRRATLGEAHPHFAVSLVNLANLYEEMGNYTAAEPLARQAQEVWHRAFGPNHPDFAQGLSSLAQLYESMGDYAAAERLLRQALEIHKTAFGEKSPKYVGKLDELVSFYSRRGNFEKAFPLVSQIMELRRNAPEEAQGGLMLSWNSLAALHLGMGEFAKAEAIYREGAENVRRSLGEKHRYYGVWLHCQAVTYLLMGDYRAAEPLFRQALEILGGTLGEHHPYLALGLKGLGYVCAATGREGEALRLQERVAVIDDQMIAQIFSGGSESQRVAYLESIRTRLFGFLSLVVQHLGNSPGAVRAAADLVLRRKALGAEALAVQRDAILGGRYPELGVKFRELTALRMQVALKALAGPGPEGLQAHQRLLEEWTDRKQRLETELVRQIPEMTLELLVGNPRTGRPATWPSCCTRAIPTGLT